MGYRAFAFSIVFLSGLSGHTQSAEDLAHLGRTPPPPSQALRAEVSPHDEAGDANGNLSRSDLKSSADIESLLADLITKTIPQATPESFKRSVSSAERLLTRISNTSLRAEYRARINHALGLGSMSQPPLIRANDLLALNKDAAIGPILEPTSLAAYAQAHQQRQKKFASPASVQSKVQNNLHD